MPRKRRASTPASLECVDEDEFTSEEKFSKEDLDNRAPRNAANARERARMRVLSKAFVRLKSRLPWVPFDTKLSKLDTLRLAATYIAHLRAILRDEGDPHPETTRSLSLTLSWPFAIQGTNTSMLMNNSCNMSSSTSASSNQYRGQQGSNNDIQGFHHGGHHQNTSIRHNHETQLSYF
ncbi:PREDICTED: transcription factor 21 [Polistes dominula]|uniref:Transcription factor 21 n=1 Tax=Polistes dominula TaxID=743375 RepID=A0ABM1IY93_POLDO|nr:PREDICTED: transcription factor 21 [Polistes dominula]